MYLCFWSKAAYRYILKCKSHKPLYEMWTEGYHLVLTCQRNYFSLVWVKKCRQYNHISLRVGQALYICDAPVHTWKRYRALYSYFSSCIGYTRWDIADVKHPDPAVPDWPLDTTLSDAFSRTEDTTLWLDFLYAVNIQYIFYVNFLTNISFKKSQYVHS